jgi:hypothetical protein
MKKIYVLLCFSLATISAQASVLISYQRNFARANLTEKLNILNDAATDPSVAGQTGHKDSTETLLKRCSLYSGSSIRVEILNALATTAQGNARVIAELNQLLDDQNSAFLTGMAPDYQAFQAGIAALGALGDESSYPVLYGVQTPVASKNILAQTALDMALSADDPASYTLRYEAAHVLAGLGWSGASESVVRHFYQAQTDYAHGLAVKERLIEAIACLGSMRTPEAAQILAIQLGLFNSQAEQTGSFDEDILLATFSALGDIGDTIAFDHLFYVDFPPYSSEVKAAAKTALAKLQWQAW